MYSVSDFISSKCSVVMYSVETKPQSSPMLVQQIQSVVFLFVDCAKYLSCKLE